jgi:glutamyl-tRNA synthetase
MTNTQQIRTRFAPSPTGYLHVGGLRSALYNYLFAKQQGGKFLLRIEDTDQTRYVEGAVEKLMHSLETCEMIWDEGPEKEGNFGPYIQSQRTEIYRKYAKQLVENEQAYPCFCTSERLESMREEQQKSGLAPRYDGHCRNLPKEEVEKLMKENTPHVIRLRIPYNQKIEFKDLVRKKVVFESKEIDDQVLIKSDGFPTYHLANVVDDHLMEITHVIRGEEWLPSTPKHIVLYHAFGWKPPIFAHLPLLLNEDRSKLSKRQGDVAVEDYLAKGYSKEAIINFIAFLGWNPGNNREVYSLEELVKEFNIEKVQKAGAIFNLEKLDWYNWIWQQRKFYEELKKSIPDLNLEPTKNGYQFEFEDPTQKEIFVEKLLELCKDFLPEDWKKTHHKKILKALYTIKDKVLKEPKEVTTYIKFFFDEIKLDTELLRHEKMNVDIETAIKSLKTAKEDLSALNEWEESSIKDVLMLVVEKLKLKNGQVLWPVRAALTGEQFSPGAFECAYVLGKDETINRLTSAIQSAQKS